MENRSRNWCWTLNNWTEEEYKSCQEWEHNKQVRYGIFGKEQGEKAETPHLQGFIIFHNAKTFNQVKRFFGDRFHIEKIVGTVQQNIAYCSKDEDYIEFGEKPKQGARKDIEQVKEQIKSGVPINQVIWNATSYQSARHAELLFKYADKPPEVKRTVKWYYGKSGTGKTRTAIEESEGDYWISGKNLKWWQGYYGQRYVIVDDFRKDFCTFHELLRIMDRYPYMVETKGGSIWIQPTTTTLVITSCYHPSDVYETREDIKQLIRRIDEIRLFKGISIEQYIEQERDGVPAEETDS